MTYVESWDVVFYDEYGTEIDRVNFPTYEDAEIYCMERDYVEVQDDGLILNMDIKRHIYKV